LSRTDLRELGWPRRAVDAIFRELDVVVPGFSRPFVRAPDYLSGLERLLEAEVLPFEQPPVIPHAVRIGRHSPLRAR
jgi:hypothetical protein